MEKPVIWNGTVSEFEALSEAVNRACECPGKRGGQAGRRCAAHQMLSNDQRAADGLVFAHRIADRLRREEWSPGAEQSAPALPPGVS